MDSVRLILPAIGFVIIAAYVRPWRQGAFAIWSFVAIAFALVSAIATELLVVRTAVAATSGIFSLVGLLFSGGSAATNAVRCSIAFVAMAAISAVIGSVPDASILRWLGLFCMLLFALSLTTVKSLDFGLSRYVIQWQLYFCFVSAAVILFFFITRGSILGSRFSLSQFMPATGTASIACHAAIACGCTAAFAQTNWKRRLFWSGWLVMVLAVLASGSRGALVSIIVVSPFMLFPKQFERQVHYRSFLMVLCTMGIVAWAYVSLHALSLAGESTLGNFLRLDREDVLSTRRSLWEGAITRGWERPIFGHGIGASSYYWAENIEETDLSGGSTVHSQFVEIFFDEGLVGIILFAGILAFSVFAALRWIEFAASHRSRYALFLCLSWLAVAIELIGHGGKTTPGNSSAVLFWINTFLISIRPDRVFTMLDGDEAMFVEELEREGA